MINSIVLTGRIVRNPELRYLPSTGNGIANFTLAVSRGFKNKEQIYETDYFPCIAWKNKAEYIANNFEKGILVELKGRVRIRSYEDKQGVKRTVSEILIRSIKKLESKKSELPQEIKENEAFYEMPEEFNENIFRAIETDDDMPF